MMNFCVIMLFLCLIRHQHRCQAIVKISEIPKKDINILYNPNQTNNNDYRIPLFAEIFTFELLKYLNVAASYLNPIHSQSSGVKLSSGLGSVLEGKYLFRSTANSCQ